MAWLRKQIFLSLHRVALVASLGLSIDAPLLMLLESLTHRSDLHELTFKRMPTFPIAPALEKTSDLLFAFHGL